MALKCIKLNDYVKMINQLEKKIIRSSGGKGINEERFLEELRNMKIYFKSLRIREAADFDPSQYETYVSYRT